MIRCRFVNVVFLLSIGWGATSCRQSDGLETELSQISFHSNVDGKEWQAYPFYESRHDDVTSKSRGALVSTNTMYRSFGCWASTYGIAETWSESSSINLMVNREINSESSYTSTTYWPGAQRKVKFFAYAPYGSAAISLRNNSTGYPAFDYTVPLQVAEQQDVLVAATGEYDGNYNNAVALNFKHALTAVRFIDKGLPQGTLTKITLSGVYGKAQHYVGKDVWDTHSDVKDFALPLNYRPSSTPGLGIEVNGGDNHFLMIPQTLPEGAGLKIEIQDQTGVTQEYTTSLAGAVWLMGKIVKYNLSMNAGALIVVGELGDWQDGGDL